MHYLVGIFVILLFFGLIVLFTASAFAIRRDFDERFDRIAARLRRDAADIVRNLRE